MKTSAGLIAITVEEHQLAEHKMSLGEVRREGNCLAVRCRGLHIATLKPQGVAEVMMEDSKVGFERDRSLEALNSLREPPLGEIGDAEIVVAAGILRPQPDRLLTQGNGFRSSAIGPE